MHARTAVAVIVSGFSVSAWADEVTLEFAGERMGAQIPYYSISVGNMIVAEGGAEKAMPSSPELGHIFEVTDKAPYTQTATYVLPDGLLDDGASIVVTLTNAAYDAASRKGTMLQLLSMAVNGTPVPVSSAASVDGGKSFFLRGTSAIINGNGGVAFGAPAGGWPNMAVAETAPVAVPAVETPVAPACSVQTTLNVTGFDNAANGLGDTATGALDTLAASLAGQACALQVVGYSSLAGAADVNMRLSAERADAVVAYLAGKGADISSADVSGAGETAQFGAAADNRRVVVTVGP